MDTQYSKEYAQNYRKSEPEISLIVHDAMKEMLKDWDKDKKVLDVATGTGRQLSLLQELGFNHIYGVDKSSEMLKEANLKVPGKVAVMKGEELALASNSRDYATVGNVLQDFDNKTNLIEFLGEITRVLKPAGEVLVVTPTPESYAVETKSFDGSIYPENQKAILQGDGSPAKILVKKTGEELTDYIWTDQNLRDIFKELNFEIIDYKTPLAKEDPSFNWPSETKSPAWAIYLLKLHK